MQALAALITTAFWGVMLVDWYRRRPGVGWLLAIVLFYPLGALLYFFAVVVPEWRPFEAWDRWRTERRRLRRLQAELILHDTVGHRQDLADLLLKHKRYAEAAEHYRCVSSKLPDDVYARYGLARSLLGLGRREEALEHLEPVVRANPRHGFGEAMLAYANTLADLGRDSPALEAYGEVLRQSSFSEASARMAQLLDRMGRREEARVLAERIVREYPAVPRYKRPSERPWLRWANGYLRQNGA